MKFLIKALQAENVFPKKKLQATLHHFGVLMQSIFLCVANTACQTTL